MHAGRPHLPSAALLSLVATTYHEVNHLPLRGGCNTQALPMPSELACSTACAPLPDPRTGCQMTAGARFSMRKSLRSPGGGSLHPQDWGTC
jgi:hypothetical protein